MGGQTMRDWRRDEEFYRKWIKADDGKAAIFKKYSNETLWPVAERKSTPLSLIADTTAWMGNVELGWLHRYSFGVDLGVLRERLFPTVAVFVEARRRVSQFTVEQMKGWSWLAHSDTGLPDYERVLRLVSLGVCLGVGPVWVGAVVEAWPGWPGGHDRLLDRLVASALPDRQIGTVDAAKRPAYGLLASAFETDVPDEQVAIITKYLDGWYKQCRKSWWWDTHSLGDLRGSGNYFGYWCFEAAAVISVLCLDADRFDSEYLPKDLAAWRSQHPDLIGTSPSPDEVDLDSVIGPLPSAAGAGASGAGSSGVGQGDA
ncbi:MULTISPECIES: PoNe immunity protein domain-containing protein [unclassified Pseudoclavibacter]|uniref:PoNe immunity protein domain-containing protein n=1 Tax=unclassified Pseudoclavibacter TaxID=2615177 RepID=UPI0013013D22|nr:MULTISPECIES: PoNe immunity protein domain-containing protein [unclassified Pseudoclavibacter]KAB1645472.1 DUF1911 domain-containing protein [Pseudoclavibacter sp. CFCC 14310]KAB1646069.1 DUF1911 domain-containing protein [Pseudoclavibacter sp. CFCC 14310]KAB1663623.1 DUF1911 domain-containing protein [Pseudoclavibacter sp. CFCC 13611]